MLSMPLTRSSALRRACVVLAVALLTGCTGEAAPAPTAPVTSAAPSASPTPSTSPTAGDLPIEPITTPPPVPADLTTPGQVGSKAAVEYFVALYGYTLNTGDTSLLRGISTPTCEYCNELASGVEAYSAQGGSIAGEAASINRMKLHERESSVNRHLWVVDVSLASRQETAQDGTRTETRQRNETSALLAVWTSGSWKIGTHLPVEEKVGS